MFHFIAAHKIATAIVTLILIGIVGSTTSKKPANHPKAVVTTQTTPTRTESPPNPVVPPKPQPKPRAKPKAVTDLTLQSTCADWRQAEVPVQNNLTAGLAGDGTPIQERITSDIQAYCARHSGSAVLTAGVPDSDLNPDYSSTYPVDFEAVFVTSATGSGVSASQASCALDAIEHSVPYSAFTSNVLHDIAIGNPPTWFTNAAQGCT